MTSSRTSSAPAAWRRALLALLVSFALGFDMMALHDVAAERSGPLGRVEIAESAIHSGAPAHFEATDVKIHYGCPGCLVQLETGLAPVRRISIAALVRGPALRAPAEREPSQAASLFRPARAPPFALSSL